MMTKEDRNARKRAAYAAAKALAIEEANGPYPLSPDVVGPYDERRLSGEVPLTDATVSGEPKLQGPALLEERAAEATMVAAHERAKKNGAATPDGKGYDEAAAMKEGWLLANSDARGLEIQRYDEAKKPFDSDSDALAFVQKKAAQGSTMHQAVLDQLPSKPTSSNVQPTPTTPPKSEARMVALAAKAAKAAPKVPSGPLMDALLERGFNFIRTERNGVASAHGYTHADGRAALITVGDGVTSCVLRRADGTTWDGQGDEVLLAAALADALKVKPLSKKAARVAAAAERGKAAAKKLATAPPTSKPAPVVQALDAIKAAQAKAAAVRQAKAAEAVPGVPAHVIRAIEMLGGVTRQRFTLQDLRGDANSSHRMAIMTVLLGYERGSGKVKAAETGITNLIKAFYSALGVPDGTIAARDEAFTARCKELIVKARVVKAAAAREEKRTIKNVKASSVAQALVVPGTILPGSKRISRKVRKAVEDADKRAIYVEAAFAEPEARPRPSVKGLVIANAKHLRILVQPNSVMSLKLERCNSQGALHLWDNGDRLVHYVLTPVLAKGVTAAPYDVEALDAFIDTLLESKSEKSADVEEVLKSAKRAVRRQIDPVKLAVTTLPITTPRESAAEPRITAANVKLLEDPTLGIVLLQLEKENSQGAICVYNNGSRVAVGLVPPEILKTLRTLTDVDVIKAANQLLNPVVPSVPVTPVAASHLTAVLHCKELIPAMVEATVSARTSKFAAPAKAETKKFTKTVVAEKPAKKAVVKAEKPAKKSAKAASNGGGSRFTDDMKITVVAKENPYNPGSKAANTFTLFAKAKTVGKFKEMAADKTKFEAGYLRYSSRDGYITVK